MAQVYRPHFYVDPATGKRVKCSFPGAVRKKSPTWHIRYWLNRRRLRVKGYSDKQATKAKAGEIERRVIRQAEGIVDPTDEHAKMPLSEHAEDFRRCLTAKGNTEEYVAKLLFRLTAVLDECRFVHIVDVQASAVIEFLGRLKQGKKDSAGLSGLSVKTRNDYLAAALQSLPIPLTPASGQGETLAATGTDGKGQISLSPSLSPRRAFLGHFERQAETDDSGTSQR